MVTAPLLVVAAALRHPSGRYLVQQRPKGKAHAGLWEFPGGKVEAGEAMVAALVRELCEELGIEMMPDALRPLTFASEGSLLLLLYTGSEWRGEAVAQEGAVLRWAAPADLFDLPMPPADRLFPAALEAHERTLTAPASP